MRVGGSAFTESLRIVWSESESSIFALNFINKRQLLLFLLLSRCLTLTHTVLVELSKVVMEVSSKAMDRVSSETGSTRSRRLEMGL